MIFNREEFRDLIIRKNIDIHALAETCNISISTIRRLMNPNNQTLPNPTLEVLHILFTHLELTAEEATLIAFPFLAQDYT
ncbi:helix-turn-helix domain-containing protein [Hutsoniella sourekii]|uniref:helix-turn-helix domain-containing protein n=1 Tax=Hutsoniella sourekii TaxID=87650 RepID=UPI00048486ED|nr:helix-turn-helix transcriptional regulator [Hutsoniella sourekii]